MTSLLSAARSGSRTPRVSKFPTTSSSAGQEAIELAASAGLHLDPWQQDVLVASLYERPGGQWASFEVGLVVARQNGKGSILEARELAGLFLFNEKMIVHTSHEFKTSLEAFRRIRYLIESTPDLDRKVVRFWQTTGYEGIELKNGCRLRFVARSKGSGRGFSGDLVILDEAFALTSDQLEALMPTMSARPNPQIWYTSSPPLDGMSGEPLFGLRARGESPEPPDSLCWFDWGAAMGANPDDREVWAQANPAMGIRITEEFVSRERAAMAPDGFARERLGVWPQTVSEQWQVIPKPAWADAILPDFGHPSPVAFAVTLSTDRQWATIGAAGPNPDGLHLVHVADRRQGTGWVVERLKQLIEKYSPVAVVIDKGSPAGSLAAEAEEAGIELTPIQARDVAAAAGALYDGVAGQRAVDPDTGELGRDPRVVRHRDQPDLNAAVAAAVKRNLSTTWAWDQIAAPADITPLIAVSNALWGYTTRAPSVESIPLVAWR